MLWSCFGIASVFQYSKSSLPTPQPHRWGSGPSGLFPHPIRTSRADQPSQFPDGETEAGEKDISLPFAVIARDSKFQDCGVKRYGWWFV